MSLKEMEKRVGSNETDIKLLGQKIDLTIGNITKAFDALTKGIDDLRHSIENGFVSKEQLEIIKTDVKNTNERVKAMEDIKAWASKIILGAVLVALLSLVIIKT